MRLADEPGVPDLLIVDYRLGRETTGVDAARVLHEEYNTDIPILLITAETDQTILREFERDGTLVLCKPIAGEHLHDAIGAVLRVTSAGVANRDES